MILHQIYPTFFFFNFKCILEPLRLDQLLMKYTGVRYHVPYFSTYELMTQTTLHQKFFFTLYIETHCFDANPDYKISSVKYLEDVFVSDGKINRVYKLYNNFVRRTNSESLKGQIRIQFWIWSGEVNLLRYVFVNP